MDIQTFVVTPFGENCYVIKDNGESLIIDPGEAAPAILQAVQGTVVKGIINTHGHCDHCGGNGGVHEKTGAPIMAHAADLRLIQSVEAQGRFFGCYFPPSPDPERLLNEGDVIEAGGIKLQVRHAPGHSPGHIVLVGEGVVFAGDVLFAGSIGRTDLGGGDYNQLLHSIRTQLLTLPDETVVYSGHGPSTTIGEERRMNPFLAGL